MSLTNDTFGVTSQTGVLISAPAPTIQNDSSTTDGGAAFSISGSALNANLLGGNTASGSLPVFAITGTIGTSSTLSAQSAPWEISYDALDVPAGITLTIAPGTVVKSIGIYDSSEPGVLSVQGTLDATGTSSDPVTFTSINDNTVGGDTGSGSPKAGDWTGISVNDSGSVSLGYTTVEFATINVNANTTGSMSLTNDTFGVTSQTGVLISAPAPTIQNDSSTTDGGAAFSISGSALNANLLGGNTASGSLPVFAITGTIGTSSTLSAQSAPWEISYDALDVPAGITLTIAPGTVVKSIGIYDSSEPGVLSVQGTLDATGTSSDPVTFTSINDNTVGGDTGSGSPKAGDWTGISVNDSGSVSLGYTTVEFATINVNANTTGSMSLTNDTFGVTSQTGVLISAPAPTIQNDSSTTDGGAAFSISGSALNANLLGGNTASGSLPVFAITGTIGTSSTLSAQSAPWEISYDALDVPAGITLTIAPGTVVKSIGIYDSSEPGVLSVQGTLDATGTSSDPVTFTSINDNTVGGDTGSGSPKAGDWTGISVNDSGSVSLGYTTVEFATSAVDANTTGSMSLTNDTFGVTSQTGVLISAPAPTIQNDSSTTDGGAAFSISGSALNANLLGGNTASGSLPVFAITGTIGTSSTLSAQSAPWEISYDALDVPAGITLTIAPGTVVKSIGIYDSSEPGVLSVQGTLDATGTSSDPVTFTSINDNTVGGDTGSGSPKAGDWTGISVNDSGSVSLGYTTVEFATSAVDANTTGSIVMENTTIEDVSSTAVQISATSGLIEATTIVNAPEALAVSHGSVTFRGNLEDVESGVSACDWNSGSCDIDATYTYWGNGSGPGEVTNGEPTVCGAVWTNPYYTSVSDTSTATGSNFAANCDGAPTPDVQLASAEQSESNAESELAYLCEYVSQSYCQQLQSDQKCLSGLISAGEAASTYAFTGPADVVENGAEFIEENASAGVSTLAQGVSFVNTISGYVSTVEDIVDALGSCF